MNSRIPTLPLLAGLTLSLASSSASANPIVDQVPGAFGPQNCGILGCWTNHLRVTDLDNDGDLDVVFVNYPDFFNGLNNPQPLFIYLNDGNGNFQNVSADAVEGYTGNLRQVAIGDVDGDGFPDIYAPSGNGGAPVLFINDGKGHFTDEADVRLPTENFPQGAAARMGDVDNDGDLDIFAADGYAVGGPPFGRLYINDGTGVFEEAVGAIPDSISGWDIADVEFADVDRDFDLDLIVNAHAGGTGALWLNDGTGHFTAGGTLAPPGPGSIYHYNIAPCDVDNDGDLDLWIDNTGGNYTEQLQINDGNGNFTDETSARVTGNSDFADDNGVVCVDIDDDGDFDAVVLSLQTAERLLVNDGTGHFTYVLDAFPPPIDCTLWGEFGDVNGDGRIDLITSQGECGNVDNQLYLGNDSMPVDTTPPRIIAVKAPDPVAVGAEAVVLFAVSDRTVTDDGPQLQRAYALVDPEGAAVEVDARFSGGDLFRAVVPSDTAGTFDLQVCAVDQAGNLGCSEATTYEVGDGGGDGDGDPGDGDPGDGDSPGDGDPGDGDASGDGDPTGETGGTGEGPRADEGDGCSCSLDGEPRGLGWSLLGLLGLGVLLRRRSVVGE